ncbi:MAG: hypothetical protein WCJ06_09915 [Planctomycetota bacterium]
MTEDLVQGLSLEIVFIPAALFKAHLPKSELNQLGSNHLIGKSVWHCSARVTGNLVSVSRR